MIHDEMPLSVFGFVLKIQDKLIIILFLEGRVLRE